MFESHQWAADSFAEIAMAEQITHLQPGAPSIAAALAAIEGLAQKQRFEETREQTGCFTLNADASSAR